jgi:hypothetical protein
LFEPVQHGLIHTKIGFRPFHLAADNARFLEYLQMLADGGLGIGENAYDLSADAGVNLNQMLNDSDPGGMAQGFENFGKLY